MVLSIECSCCISPRARWEERRQRKGPAACTVCIVLPLLFLSAHSSGFTAHTTESHGDPWIYTSMYPHTHTRYFIPPGMIHGYPPHFPGEQWLRVRGEAEEKDRAWSRLTAMPNAVTMSRLAFSALRRQSALCATELLLNMSFMMHSVVLVTTATVARSSIGMHSQQVSFIILSASTCFPPLVFLYCY